MHCPLLRVHTGAVTVQLACRHGLPLPLVPDRPGFCQAGTGVWGCFHTIVNSLVRGVTGCANCVCRQPLAQCTGTDGACAGGFLRLAPAQCGLVGTLWWLSAKLLPSVLAPLFWLHLSDLASGSECQCMHAPCWLVGSAADLTALAQCTQVELWSAASVY